MEFKKYKEDDYCDIYPNRICDNCGDCLEEEGIDVRAIQIEDIAKNIEENEFLEEEYKNMLEIFKREEKETKEEELLENENMEYVDAFDNIEYIEDLDLEEDDDLDNITEEVFPGVRKLKHK
ncbi:hypothetical protein [Clostridium sp.]|uniref:hypothetical protein n=1 Tax=Clostridium sp. TaxID=1506 RepID=UPI00261304D9|nr:hypothetical protein [Clostridium sp.]